MHVGSAGHGQPLSDPALFMTCSLLAPSIFPSGEWRPLRDHVHIGGGEETRGRRPLGSAVIEAER